MWIDPNCPVELEHWERVGDLRRGQIYLHFLSLTEAPLKGLRVWVTPLDAQGQAVASAQEHGLNQVVEGRERFILHFATDSLPGFAQLDIFPVRVLFEDGSTWRGEEEDRVDASFVPLDMGPERVALVALAGKDALCFPERKGEHWRCVCGRLNLGAAEQCIRCGREEAVVFEEFNPERIEERYQALYQQRVERERAQRRRDHEERARQAREDARRKRAHHMRKRRQIAGLAVGAIVLLLAWILWLR